MKAFFLAMLVAGAAITPAVRAQAPIETPQQRESYRIYMRQELDKLGERLSALELRSHVESSRARENLSTRTGELRAQKKRADELFGKIETGTDAERAQARARLDDAVKALRTGIEQAEGANPNWGS